MTVCLDANVWVYFLDADLPEHDAVAPQVDAVLATEPLFTTAVLQMEVVHYVANNLTDSADTVEEFLSLPETVVADLTTEDVRRGSALLEERPNAGIGGRDASVLAAMDRYDIDRLWTHDHALAAVADDIGHAVHDPVEAELPEEYES